MTDRVDISRLLQDMRSMKAQTQVFPRMDAPQKVGEINLGLRQIGGVTETTKVPGFSDLFSKAVNNVNDTQQRSSSMANAYERGVAGVDITDVMIASQKASVAFQATVQVRNKVIEAYKDVMNMAI